MAGQKGSTFDNDLLKLIFRGVGIANIADNATSGPLAALQVSLHTADPGPAGNQTTSEVAYTGYARVAVTRANDGTAGWTVTTNSVVPVATISFPACSDNGGGTPTAAYWAVGTASGSGTGKILYSGPISPTIAISSGVTPQLTTASTITEA
jgi:hypothetical protein